MFSFAERFEMMEPTKKLLLNIQEVSAITGISVGTLYHWVSQRRLPVVRISQRCIRFDLVALQAWIAEKAEPPKG